MLIGRLPIDMLDLQEIHTVFDQVEQPGTNRVTSIVRLAAEGELEFGVEETKDGEKVLVAGSPEWGWKWRIKVKADWRYMNIINKEAQKDKVA